MKLANHCILFILTFYTESQLFCPNICLDLGLYIIVFNSTAQTAQKKAVRAMQKCVAVSKVGCVTLGLSFRHTASNGAPAKV